jgi:hypothetical protein
MAQLRCSHEEVGEAKEQVWKIQKISQPYSEKRDEDAERANYIDIYINEKELIDQLIEDIEGLFNPDELEDYGVSDEKAFIEFKNYRVKPRGIKSTERVRRRIVL